MPETGALILVVEDETPLRRFLKTTMNKHQYRCVEAETAKEGMEMIVAQRPDLVLLDLGLPDLDGLELTRQLRTWTKVPIVVLTARGQEQDKVAALDAGADDYLTKPFGVNELLARIRVALRHAASTSEAQSSVFAVASLRVDLIRRQVFVGEQEVHLTPTEYKLLSTLARNAGRVVTHRQLLREVWGPGYERESNYLRVHMTQLRHKLEADPTRPRYIVTELGVGYRLRDE